VGKTPGAVDGADVGPVARPSPKDALIGRENPLGWFDDVEQGDVCVGSGEAVAAVWPGGRGEQSLGHELGEDSLQEVRGGMSNEAATSRALRGPSS
jgi:hypothetical protein